jgi:hypothetical protein
MAELTEQEYQQLIVAEVGDDSTRTLASTVGVYWRRYDAYTDLEVRYLHVKLAAVDLMLGRVRGQVTIRDGDGASVDLNKLFDHLATMRETVQAQIDIGVGAGSAASGGAIGVLTKTAPIMPPAGSLLDANDPAYRGDPYRPRRVR